MARFPAPGNDLQVEQHTDGIQVGSHARAAVREEAECASRVSPMVLWTLKRRPQPGKPRRGSLERFQAVSLEIERCFRWVWPFPRAGTNRRARPISLRGGGLGTAA